MVFLICAASYSAWRPLIASDWSFAARESFDRFSVIGLKVCVEWHVTSVVGIGALFSKINCHLHKSTISALSCLI